MLLPILAIIVGLVVLVWSADRFVEGAAATARHFGMPALLIGMIIVGFGTSAPEMVVSALAASQGNPGIALGNAYGSNITNIGLILGVTALLSPIAVHSQVLRKEMPVLIALTALAALQLMDGFLSRLDAAVLLGTFFVLVWLSIRGGLNQPDDSLGVEVAQDLDAHPMPLRSALIWLVVGLLLLIASSRVLVWGAVSIAQQLGVSDLIIGLTIVAVGTSLPELASSIMAVRKKEHDIALGNIIGSNVFNTLAVVGIAGSIHPLPVEAAILTRDMAMVGVLTVLLFIFAFGFRGPARLNRLEGGVLLLLYAGYNIWLVRSVFLQ